MRRIPSGDINTRQGQNRWVDTYYRKVVRVFFAFHSEKHGVPCFKEHVSKIPKTLAVWSFDFLPSRDYALVINRSVLHAFFQYAAVRKYTIHENRTYVIDVCNIVKLSDRALRVESRHVLV